VKVAKLMCNRLRTEAVVIGLPVKRIKLIEMLAQDRSHDKAKAEQADRERLLLMQTLLERQTAASSGTSS
jgi:hypothetical protein